MMKSGKGLMRQNEIPIDEGCSECGEGMSLPPGFNGYVYKVCSNCRLYEECDYDWELYQEILNAT